jgi:F-type H+-transporting ATPase subunit b
MEALGINLANLLIYSVLFLVFYWLMDKFLFSSLVEALNKRKEQIKKGLELTVEMEKKMNNLEKEYEKKLEKAGNEARAIIKQAKAEADQLKSVELEKAKKSIAEIIENAKVKADAEREKMKEGIKKEMSSLIVDTLEAVLADSLDEKSKHKLVDKAIEKIS